MQGEDSRCKNGKRCLALFLCQSLPPWYCENSNCAKPGEGGALFDRPRKFVCSPASVPSFFCFFSAMPAWGLHARPLGRLPPV